MNKKAEPLGIHIPPIDIRKLEIVLVGDTPLVHHRWPDKSKKEILDKQMKKAKQKKEAKDPAEDYAQSAYILDEKKGDRKRMKEGDHKGLRFGFPTIAFKKAAVGACRFSDGLKMTEARGAFHFDEEFVEIQSDGPEMREDMVRIGMGTADIRYRAAFSNWKAKISISYNASAFSIEQIISLFNLAGFGVGVGEWRPEKDGNFGRFHVAAESDL